MLVFSSDVEVNGYKIFPNEISIVSTWENLTDTGYIKFARRSAIRKDNNIHPKKYELIAGPDAIWRRGDPVRIDLGYNGNLTNRFTGVLTGVKNGFPSELYCEDSMFLLKQKTISTEALNYINNGERKTLKALLKKVFPGELQDELGFTVEHEDAQLGRLQPITTRITIAQFLNGLRTQYGLSCFFQDGKLYVGVAYKFSSIEDIATKPITAQFQFQRNIIDASNLQWQRADDVMMKVTATNWKTVNGRDTSKTFEFGDPDGATAKTLHFYDADENDLERLAMEELKKYKYEGFSGSFTTFMDPPVKHGQAIKLIDTDEGTDLYPYGARTGVYLVKQVITTFSFSGGGRQEITLDRLIS